MARTVTTTATAGGLITLFGADNVTIDGSLSGGTDRSLNLINANTTTSGTTVVAIISQGAAAGATNNTIKNCVIQNGTTFNSSTSSFNFGIYAGGNGSANGPDNDNLTIENNLIQRCYYGMQVVGDTSGLLDNLVIQDNTIGGAVAADYFGRYGMLVGQATGAVITRNTVRNSLFTGGADGFGIILNTGFLSSSVTRNTVNNLEANNSGGYGFTGISIQTATAASSVTVANNFIYDIRGTSWTSAILGDVVVGIRITGTNTGGVNVYANSVNLFGDYLGASTATITAAFMVNATTPTALDVRDNIFVNSFNNTTVTSDKNYAIYTNSANTMFTDINYNDYYVSGPQGVLGAINSADVTSIGTLRTATTKDLQSKNAPPMFASDTNLHINMLSSQVLNMGFPLASVTIDFDGEPRSTGMPPMGPDIGADELPAIQEFRLQYFSQTANSGAAANDQDPDADGLTNLQEFAFGTDPTMNTTNDASYSGNVVTPGLPTTMVVNTQFAVNYFVLYTRRDDYVAAGLTFTVQFSADMMTWVDSTDSPTVVADDGTYQAVTVRYPFFLPDGRKANFFQHRRYRPELLMLKHVQIPYPMKNSYLFTIAALAVLILSGALPTRADVFIPGSKTSISRILTAESSSTSRLGRTVRPRSVAIRLMPSSGARA